MAVGGVLVGLFAVAVAIFALYLFYSLLHRAFRRVGFTTGEAAVILFGTIVGAAWNIPIWPTPVGGGWILAVNVGGAVVPVAVSIWLLRRLPSMALQAFVAATLVSLVVYLVTHVEPTGIVVPAALALFPPLVAAVLSLTAHWREEDHAAPLAYVAGTFGALVGADVLRLAEFLAQTPPADAVAPVASIGGAAAFDMVFLTGVLAVGLDALVFRERRKVAPAELPYKEAEVFTVGTSPERMAAWHIPEPPKAQIVHAEEVTPRGERVRYVKETPARAAATTRPAASRPRPPPATVAELERSAVPGPEDDRLARHRAWEEQMRRRRGG